MEYSYNLFFVRIKAFFVDSFLNFSTFREVSFLPMDVSYKYLLDDFRKKLLFFYESISSINYATDLFLRSYFMLDDIKYNRFLFLKSDVNFTRDVFRDSSSISSLSEFEFKVPFNHLFCKLRFLGFVHVYKSRPIANVNYIFFEDFFILLF